MSKPNANEIVRALRGAPNYNAGIGTSTIEDEAADLIERLQAQLKEFKAFHERFGELEAKKYGELHSKFTESQRRERAAVEDLCAACEALCRASGHGWESSCYDCKWWRGPQDEKGEAE